MVASSVDVFSGVGREGLPKSGTVIVSGDYKATDPTAAEFSTRGIRAFDLATDITAQSGSGNTLTVNVEGFEPASGKWVMVTSVTYLTVGTHLLPVDPRTPGVVKVCPLTQPAAAAQFAAITVPTGVLWELVSASYTSVTDANVANRNHKLTIKTPAGTIAGEAVTNAQVASTTARISFQSGTQTAQGQFGATPDIRSLAGLPHAPGTMLAPGWSVEMGTISALQAADQLSGGVLVFRERIPALYEKMRIRPVGSGTRTTLTYSVGLTALA